MKFTTLLLPSLAAFTLTSCVVPAYDDPGGNGSAGVSYGTYEVLPNDYQGDAYYYGGRYYSGGRYESGRFYDQGQPYGSRYYHNGQYYYGGHHEHHGGGGSRAGHGGNHDDPRDDSGHGAPSWQMDHSGQPYSIRRTR